MAKNPLYKEVSALAKSKVVDATLVAAWAKGARAACKVDASGERSPCMAALGEVLTLHGRADGVSGLWGPAWVSLLLEGDTAGLTRGAELFNYLLPEVADAVLAAHVPDLLTAVERGASMIADVKRHRLGVRREIDNTLAKLLEVADRIGVSKQERARFEGLVVGTAHGWPGLDGGSSFAAYSDLAEKFLHSASQAMVAFPATCGYELLAALFRADQGEAVVTRVLALVGPTPEPTSAQLLLQALATAAAYLNGKPRKGAVAAIERHADELLSVAESLVGRRTTWVPDDADYEAVLSGVAALLAILLQAPATRDPKRLARVASLLRRQALELPTTSSSLRPLRAMGAGSIPLLVEVLRHWLPRITVKEAAASMSYSGSTNVAIVYVEACLLELFGHTDQAAASAALVAEARTWSVTEAQVFLTLVCSEAHHFTPAGPLEPFWAKRGAIVVVVLAALPPVVQKPPATKKLLVRARKLFGDAPLPKLSKKPPADLDEAFALLGTLGLDRSDVRLGAGLDETAVATLPEVLRPLYARANGAGGGAIVKSAQLAALAKRFKGTVQRAIKEEPAPWKRFSPPESLVPIGDSGSGDVYFLDPARGDVVFRYDHEEQEPGIEHKTLATFVARIIIERWGELASQQELAQETFVRWIPNR